MSPFLRLILVLSLILALSTAPAVSASSCTPIFTSPLSLLNGSTLIYPSTPTTKAATSPNVCPHIPVGSTTCCSADTDAQLNTITDTLLAFRNSLATTAPAALLQSLFHDQAWLDLTGEHVQWRNLSTEQQYIVRTYINVVTPLLTGATPCVDAILTRIQGLLCWSCDVGAGQFVEHGMVKVAWRARDYANEACLPVLSSVMAAVPTLLDLYIGFLLTLPAPLPPLASASLSQSYLLRAVMSSGLSSAGVCQSAWAAMLAGRYHSMSSCFELMTALLDRGLDWDVRGWLNLTAGEENAISLPPMGSGEGIAIKPSGGGMDGGHSAHRRLLSVVMDEADSTKQVAAVSSFGTFSSVVGNLWSRFHVMHGGLHEGDMDTPATTSTIPTLRIFPPAPTDDTDTHSHASTNNGHIMSAYGDDGDTGTTYYPTWLVGCTALEQRGLLCPMADERSKGHDKAVFLGVVAGVGLAVGCAMLVAYRTWVASGGGGGGGGEEGEGGGLGVGKKMVRRLKAGIGRRLAQRSRLTIGPEEAEGILAE